MNGLRLPAEGLSTNRNEGESNLADLDLPVSEAVRDVGGLVRGSVYQTRERKLQKEEVGGALVAADLAQGERARLVAAGFARTGLFF